MTLQGPKEGDSRKRDVRNLGRCKMNSGTELAEVGKTKLKSLEGGGGSQQK